MQLPSVSPSQFDHDWDKRLDPEFILRPFRRTIRRPHVSPALHRRVLGLFFSGNRELWVVVGCCRSTPFPVAAGMVMQHMGCRGAGLPPSPLFLTLVPPLTLPCAPRVSISRRGGLG